MHICVTLFGEEHLRTAVFTNYSHCNEENTAGLLTSPQRFSLRTVCAGDYVLNFLTLFGEQNIKSTNVVGQQIPTLLDATCCVRLHTLLHAVGSLWTKFEIDETFSSRANGRKIPKMLGVLASNVESVARGFTSR